MSGVVRSEEESWTGVELTLKGLGLYRPERARGLPSSVGHDRAPRARSVREPAARRGEVGYTLSVERKCAALHEVIQADVDPWRRQGPGRNRQASPVISDIRIGALSRYRGKVRAGVARASKELSMAKTIEQTVEFTGVSAERLFETYMDAKQHAAAIAAPVEMDRRVGGRFSAFGGLIGRNILIESPRLIVQTWRATLFREEDADSVLVLLFEKTDAGARVRLVQANVPEHAVQTIEKGWQQHYWSRWTRYFENQRESAVH